MELDTHELAWAAGFFDGEGCISVGGPINPRGRLVVTAVQADRRPLERFRTALGGLGVIGGPKRNGPGLPIYVWRTSDFEQAQAVIAMLWRYMAPPRREQALRCLGTMAEYHAVPRLKPGPKPKPTCPNGHPYEDPYLTREGWRLCRVCLRDRRRRADARRSGPKSSSPPFAAISG